MRIFIKVTAIAIVLALDISGCGKSTAKKTAGK